MAEATFILCRNSALPHSCDKTTCPSFPTIWPKAALMLCTTLCQLNLRLRGYVCTQTRASTSSRRQHMLMLFESPWKPRENSINHARKYIIEPGLKPELIYQGQGFDFMEDEALAQTFASQFNCTQMRHLFRTAATPLLRRFCESEDYCL